MAIVGIIHLIICHKAKAFIEALPHSRCPQFELLQFEIESTKYIIRILFLMILNELFQNTSSNVLTLNGIR